MNKRVKQYGFDIVVDYDNDNWLYNRENVEDEIEKAIEDTLKKYKLKLAGFMFQEDVTEQYKQYNLF